MALDIFIHMHGGWMPTYDYTNVPKGCSLTFWSPYAKLLPSSTAREILAGTWTGKPDRVVNAYGRVPNMGLFPLDATSLAGDVKARSSAAGRAYFSDANAWLLGNVMVGLRNAVDEKETVAFHWLCCQELMLKDAGGGKHGVNAGDLRHKGFYQFMWKDSKGAPQSKYVSLKGNT